MAFKPTISLSFFPPNLSTPKRRFSVPTEIRFSRWNNANAEPFNRPQRLQKQIEDDLRRQRRFQSATKIADPCESDNLASTSASSQPPEFKSIGTPSRPSPPSIRGKASKYSKPENPRSFHPAFDRIARSYSKDMIPQVEPDREMSFSISDKGIAYELKNAPFEFQHSYTETPKVKPLALREPPFMPFGPTTMPRPWTGRAPISKKKFSEFDSFKLPPSGKKGVKSVQAPGPYQSSSGPNYMASTREEILGEPLSKEEIKDLIIGCFKCTRQHNIGRDGLTHNMLDNIHTYWKRRRVCKIKCRGVCTVDMDNVRHQIEEKTGGKIIFSKGGLIFLYRGRNYNYRTRPKYPLMLWKPFAPFYPRLIQNAPEGLSLEEATQMRKKGGHLPPICKLGKNGVYENLVKNVKEAFEECELVRINCTGMHKSDYRKIGAKLRDLVPCILVSFETEHILMWRGKYWKSSFQPLSLHHEATHHITDVAVEEKKQTMHAIEKIYKEQDSRDISRMSIVELQQTTLSASPIASTEISDSYREGDQESPLISDEVFKESSSQTLRLNPEEDKSLLITQSNGISFEANVNLAELDSKCHISRGLCETSNASWLNEVMILFKQAVEDGNALVLDEGSLDADIVLSKSIEFSKTSLLNPTFQHLLKESASQKDEIEKSKSSEEEDVETSIVSVIKGDEKQKLDSGKMEELLLNVIPHGNLRVDQLANLLD